MTPTKIVLTVAALIGILPLMCFQALAQYDKKVRREELTVVARELRVGAQLDEVRAFMERHTSRFALDDTYHHVYGGFTAQTKLDRYLFDRQVQINLYLDQNHKFTNAEVTVYYTFL